MINNQFNAYLEYPWNIYLSFFNWDDDSDGIDSHSCNDNHNWNDAHNCNGHDGHDDSHDGDDGDGDDDDDDDDDDDVDVNVMPCHQVMLIWQNPKAINRTIPKPPVRVGLWHWFHNIVRRYAGNHLPMTDPCMLN